MNIYEFLYSQGFLLPVSMLLFAATVASVIPVTTTPFSGLSRTRLCEKLAVLLFPLFGSGYNTNIMRQFAQYSHIQTSYFL